MSLASTKASGAYREALTATKAAWEDSSVGIIEKGSLVPSFATVSQQLNTTVFLLTKLEAEVINLKEQLDSIETRIKSLERREISPAATPDLASITSTLENLRISPKPKEVGGKLKVYKNPFEILRAIKN